MAFEGLQRLSAVQDCHKCCPDSKEASICVEPNEPDAGSPITERWEQQEGDGELTCNGAALVLAGEEKVHSCWSSDSSQARNLRSTHRLKMLSRNTERRHASRKHYLLTLRSDFVIEGEAPEKKPCTQREKEQTWLQKELLSSVLFAFPGWM